MYKKSNAHLWEYEIFRLLTLSKAKGWNPFFMDVWKGAEINRCGWWRLVKTRPRALHYDVPSINSSFFLGRSQGSEETARVWQGSTALANSAQQTATLIPMTKEIWIIAALIWIPLHHITLHPASPLRYRTKPPTFPLIYRPAGRQRPCVWGFSEPSPKTDAGSGSEIWPCTSTSSFKHWMWNW